MENETRQVHIHADESCLGNQFADRDRPGGAAALLEYAGERLPEAMVTSCM